MVPASLVYQAKNKELQKNLSLPFPLQVPHSGAFGREEGVCVPAGPPWEMLLPPAEGAKGGADALRGSRCVRELGEVREEGRRGHASPAVCAGRKQQLRAKKDALTFWKSCLCEAAGVQ